MYRLSNFLIVCFACAFTRAEELPKTIKKCKYSDSECIIETGNNILHDVSNGFADLDPLPLKRWELGSGAHSSVNIKLVVRNAELTGLKDFNVYKMEGFRKNMEGVNEIRIKGDKIAIKGPYTINGQVLILPIQGNGMSNLTLTNPDFHLKFSGKPFVKDGKTYFRTDNLKMKMTLTRLYMYFENLYNGDKLLGPATNQFINENWQDIYGELKQSILKSMALVLQETTNKAFAKVPYEDLFLKEDE